MYLVNRIKGNYYLCDRCQDCEDSKQIISFREYMRNKKNGNHYCDECWSYMNLQKGQCECGSKYTGRQIWKTSYIMSMWKSTMVKVTRVDHPESFTSTLIFENENRGQEIQVYKWEANAIENKVKGMSLAQVMALYNLEDKRVIAEW